MKRTKGLTMVPMTGFVFCTMPNQISLLRFEAACVIAIQELAPDPGHVQERSCILMAGERGGTHDTSSV